MEEEVTSLLFREIVRFGTLEAEDGHWLGDYGGPLFLIPETGILSDALKCLGDNKKHMRECTLNTLDLWVLAVQLAKMVPYVTAMLADPKKGVEGRKDLFDWLAKHLSKINNSSEALHLLKPTAAPLSGKSAEVRKGAEASLGEILRVCGQEALTKSLKDMHEPALSLVLERMRPSGLPLEEMIWTSDGSLSL